MAVTGMLLNTIPITDTLPALVTFTYPRSAADYVTLANLYPISFMGMAAAIAMIDTPFFPMSPHIFHEVKAWNFTRVLRLSGVRFTKAKLLSDLDLYWAARLSLIERIQIQNEFSVVQWLFAHSLPSRPSNTAMAKECSSQVPVLDR
ncbi:MAG: hypothetical protein M1839_003974 [Geoglossum umbratile]|nr:MAG: hypothetical protein M1839_003974 [Geoglossum umbratile]